MRTIPDYTDEDLLTKLMAGKAVMEGSDKDTAPCSRVVPPHIEMKIKSCCKYIFFILPNPFIDFCIKTAHPHIINGKTQSYLQIIHYNCPTQCTIYVPQDPDLCVALVVHRNNIPHNHPMSRMSKVLLEAKAAYEECVEAASIVGATVQKVDNGEHH